MNPREERDEWLMAQVALGKREHLELLVRRYASPLLTFIQRMVGDRHQGEELFQEVFLAVWRNRRQYQFPRPFKAWLYAIAVNRCRAAFRSRKPGSPGSLDDEVSAALPASGPSPADTAIATEQASLVLQAVAQLPTQQRLVVVLRIWDDLSYTEIADVLKRSEGTVRANMHHALAAIRQQLEPRLR